MAYAMRAVGCGGEPMSCTCNTHPNARGPGRVWGIRWPRAMDLGTSYKYHKCGIKRQKTRRVATRWVIKNDSQSEEREADKWLLENPSVPNLSEKDIEKEIGRRYERSLLNFTFDRWASHRSSARYIRHMLGIFQSSIVRGLAQPLLSVAGVSTVVCLYEDLLARGAFPDSFPSFLMPTAPFDLTSFALSLLLVFRTNTSYDRWLEISTVWSGLANRARDTMRQVISHLSDSSGTINPLAAAMCRWVVAYARSLKAEVTEGCDLSQELSEILTEEELKLLLCAHHRPSFALSVLTELGAAAPLRESHRIRLDENLTYFEDAVGSCERILRTPIPLSYTRHTSRFMVIWLSTLPLGLYGTCSYATIPLTIVIAFLLLGIDEIGVQIEEPFGLLPLDDLCAEIEGDLFGILREAVLTKRTAAAAAAAALGGIDGPMESPPSSPLLPMQRGNRGRAMVARSNEVGLPFGFYEKGSPDSRDRRSGWVEFGGRVASMEKVLGSLDEDL